MILKKNGGLTMNRKIKYLIDKFPSSEKFQIFKVFNDCIWQILNPKSYYIDSGDWDYFYFVFDDPVTAEIICNYLNEAEREL